METKRVRGGLLTRVVVIAFLALLILGSMTAYGYSKYTAQTVVAGEVRYVNQLVKRFAIQDARTVRADNTYKLIPGTTLELKPAITIEGKTEIPAYLYVEVVETNLDTAISYTLTDDWTKLDGVTGLKGGQIYVYKDKLDGTTKDFDLAILNGGIELGKVPLTGENEFLDFAGYLVQAVEDNTATEQFRASVR